MAFDLNLKTEWIDKETLRVSWSEPHSIYHEGTVIKGSTGYIAAVCLIASLALPIFTGEWIFLILFPLSIAIAVVGIKTQPLQKSVTFRRDKTEFSGTVVPTQNITRIAIDDTLKWKNLSENDRKKARLQTQILLWVDEEEPFELSLNNITPQTNAVIRNALDKALQDIRKTAVEVEREETHGKTGDFGVPEY